MSSLSSIDFSRSSPVDGYYDVFLSFRGIDTRKGFTTNLYHALQDNEIHTFMDEDLIGEDIDHLFKVIAISRMAVVIYSENFASSDWCLRELETIMEHREDKKMLVTPIFYKVDLKELKHLTGKTAQYLGQHKAAASVYDASTIELWKAAVTKLGGVSGISYKEIEYRSEYEFMKHVIARIKKQLLTLSLPPTQDQRRSIQSSIVKKQWSSSSSDPSAVKHTSSLNQLDDKEESDNEESSHSQGSSRNETTGKTTRENPWTYYKDKVPSRKETTGKATLENPRTTFDKAKVPDHYRITSRGFSYVKPLTGDTMPNNIRTNNASSSGETSNGTQVRRITKVSPITRTRGAASNNPRVMKIYVRGLFRPDPVIIQVDPGTTIGNLKAQVQKILGLKVTLDKQRLYYNGDEELKDSSRSLASYNIPDGATLCTFK